MKIVEQLTQVIAEKRDELTKLEAALAVLVKETPFELKHPTGKEKPSKTTQQKRRRSRQSSRRYRRKRVVMPHGHYESIIGTMAHADAGREFSPKDVVTFARSTGAHATKSAVQAIVTKMTDEGWLERCGTRGREVLYRRAVMDPARWSTLYKDEGR